MNLDALMDTPQIYTALLNGAPASCMSSSYGER